MSGNVHANSNFSPTFIKAKTPEDLEKQMLENNLIKRKVFDYRSIQFVGGFWYAWYDTDSHDSIRIIRKQARS